MRIRLLACSLLGALLVSPAAGAHGGKQHAGATFDGVIEAVSTSTQSLTLGTPRGPVTVTLTDESEIVSENEQPLGREALRPGLHVVVVGHRLPGGGVAAAEVTVHAQEAPSPDREPAPQR